MMLLKQPMKWFADDRIVYLTVLPPKEPECCSTEVFLPLVFT